MAVAVNPDLKEFKGVMLCLLHFGSLYIVGYSNELLDFINKQKVYSIANIILNNNDVIPSGIHYLPNNTININIKKDSNLITIPREFSNNFIALIKTFKYMKGILDGHIYIDKDYLQYQKNFILI